MLLGVLGRSHLSDDRDLDLTRILHIVLDLLGNLTGKFNNAQVVHLVRLDDDAYLAPGLNGVGFFHAGEGLGNVFQRRHTLDVGFEGLTAGPRSGAGDGIRGGDDNRL